MSEAGSREQGIGNREFDLELTRAMQRVDVPEGFAARIMDRVAEPAAAERVAAKVIPFRSRVQRYAGLGLAAMLALGVFGIDQMHKRHEREVADREFALSMQIEERAMEHTRVQLEKAGVPFE